MNEKQRSLIKVLFLLRSKGYINDDVYFDFLELVTDCNKAQADAKFYFESGAQSEKVRTISKACKWLCQQQLVLDDVDMFINDFRKAMEGEK